jgi:hypothetical protein
MRCQHTDGTFVDSGSENPDSSTPTPAPKSGAEQVRVGVMMGGIMGVATGMVLLL